MRYKLLCVCIVMQIAICTLGVVADHVWFHFSPENHSDGRKLIVVSSIFQIYFLGWYCYWLLVEDCFFRPPKRRRGQRLCVHLNRRPTIATTGTQSMELNETLILQTVTDETAMEESRNNSATESTGTLDVISSPSLDQRTVQEDRSSIETVSLHGIWV